MNSNPQEKEKVEHLKYISTFGEVLIDTSSPYEFEYILIEDRVSGTKHQKRICYLVAEKFLDEPSQPWAVIRHLDGNNKNNHPDNLIWVTYIKCKTCTSPRGPLGRKKCPNSNGNLCCCECHTYQNRLKHRRGVFHLRDIIYKAKDQPCHDCGESFDKHSMTFDHVWGVKSFNIGEAPNIRPRLSTDKLLEEIDKCEVVCRPCHDEREWVRLNEENNRGGATSVEAYHPNDPYNWDNLHKMGLF